MPTRGMARDADGTGGRYSFEDFSPIPTATTTDIQKKHNQDMAREKQYNKTAADYAGRLARRGMAVRFNWTGSDMTAYEDVTVIGKGDYPTPRAAYEALAARRRV